MRLWSVTLLLILFTGCASSTPSPSPSSPSESTSEGDESRAQEAVKPPPPWSNPPLQRANVPAVYFTEHKKAENRATCALLVPAEVPSDAKPRRANFYGGWAIAYDQPGKPGVNPTGADCASCGRSAFGVAGTGVEGGGATYQWPNVIEYEDGSSVGYGLEGGNGPGWLAFVTIPGQRCLYNVWSHSGQAELEELIRNLRFVEE